MANYLNNAFFDIDYKKTYFILIKNLINFIK